MQKEKNEIINWVKTALKRQQEFQREVKELYAKQKTVSVALSMKPE